MRRRTKNLRNLICVQATSRPELLFLRVQDECWRSDVLGYCECRNACADEESNHKDLQESDHVHEDHADLCLPTGTGDCLVMFPFSTVQFVCIHGVLRSLRCCCLLLGIVVRPCIGLGSKPVL